MALQTKARILQNHESNDMLRATVLPTTRRHENDLSADEIFAPLDEAIVAATVDALEAGQTHYVDVPGIAPLREAIASYLRTEAGSPTEQANVLVTAGMQEARFLTIQIGGEQFERIAVPSVVHPGVRKAIGVRPKPVEWIEVDDQTLLPTVDAIRSALEAGAQLLFLESPSRLTGAAYDAATVAEIAALVTKHDATVIWDQGLAPFADDYVSLAAQADMGERVLAIGEAFPGMGLSSWFIGYIAAPTSFVPKMQSQKQIMAICTSTPSQYAALQASKMYVNAQASTLKRLSSSREKAVAAVGASGGEILAGNAATVLAVRLSADAKAETVARLSAAGYTAADGADFGASNVLRLTIGHGNVAEQAVSVMTGKG